MSYRHNIIALNLKKLRSFYGGRNETFLRKAISGYQKGAGNDSEDIEVMRSFVFGTKPAEDLESEMVFREFLVNSVIQEIEEKDWAEMDGWSPHFLEFYENLQIKIDIDLKKYIDLLNIRPIFGGWQSNSDQPYGYLTNNEAVVLMDALEKIQPDYIPGDFGGEFYKWLKKITPKGLDIFTYSG